MKDVNNREGTSRTAAEPHLIVSLGAAVIRLESGPHVVVVGRLNIEPLSKAGQMKTLLIWRVAGRIARNPSVIGDLHQ